MNITMLGAGAMGSVFGGLLAEAGHDVWLLDIWQEHVRQITAQGLWIEGVSGTRSITNIHATDNPSEVGKPDIVFVFVKSTVTDAAIQQARQIFRPDTLVVTLQNGLGNIEKIGSVVNADRIIAGTTAHGATVLDAGRIRHAGAGATVIGKIDHTVDSEVNALANMLCQAHISTTVSTNIAGIIWDKLLVNVGINALTAITRLHNGRLIEYQETEDILERAVNEALMVARAKEITLSHDDPVSHTKKVCQATAANKSSMLQDVLQKRKTEIEMINGAIVREGQQLGIPTPVNTVLTNLVSVIEKTYSA